MKRSALNAWMLGVVILVVAFGLWLVVLKLETFGTLAMVLLLASLFTAALLASYFSPQKKILIGTSLAVPAAILATILNAVYQMLGHAVDLSGLEGGITLFLIVLVESAIVCLLGGVAGYFLARLTRRNSKLA